MSKAETITFIICVTLVIISIITMIMWIYTPQMIIDINFNMIADNNSVEIIRTLNNSVFGEMH